MLNHLQICFMFLLCPFQVVVEFCHLWDIARRATWAVLSRVAEYKKIHTWVPVSVSLEVQHLWLKLY